VKVIVLHLETSFAMACGYISNNLDFWYIILLNFGANKLIETIGAPLGDFLLGNILEIFSKKTLKNLLKSFCAILLRFLLKICQKYVIFKVFQVHLQVLLLLKNNRYKYFYTTFEGPNVNEIISYLKNLKNRILNLIMCKNFNLFSN
jgi:hypothetical protein